MMFFTVILIALFGTSVLGQQAILSAPDSLMIGSSDLHLRCDFTESGTVTFVSNIQIYRNSSAILGSDESRVVSVYTGQNGTVVEWQDSDLETRGMAAGEVGSVGQVDAFFLEVNLTMTECNDSATYRCRVQFISSGTTMNEENEKTVDPIAEPDDLDSIQATAVEGTLSSTGLVTNETVLVLSCSGSVGSPPGSLRWCRMLKDMTYTEMTSNVVDYEAVAADNCQYNGSSILQYNVSNADTGTTFLCEVNGTYSCGGASVSQTFYITTVETRNSPSGSSTIYFQTLVMVLLVLCVTILN